jgi:hypothetical protein
VSGLPTRIGLAAGAGIVALIVFGTTAWFLGDALTLLFEAKGPVKPAAGVNGVANGIAADLGALAAQQIVNTTREHPYGTMGAALAAGIAVGAIPELRKTLTGLLKH